MISPPLPAGTAAASRSSSCSGCAPSSGARALPVHASTARPLLIAPPITHAPGVSAKQNSRPAGSTPGRSTVSRRAPPVPIEQAATPGRAAPRPGFASGPSPPPTTNGVPRASPSSPESRLNVSSHDHTTQLVALDTRDRQRHRVPIEALDRHQARATRARPIDGPIRREPMNDHLLDAHHLRTRLNTSGSFSRNQISFGWAAIARECLPRGRLRTADLGVAAPPAGPGTRSRWRRKSAGSSSDGLWDSH